MESYVRLKILSDHINAEQITNTVGIDCDRSWSKGELRPKTQIKEKQNGWVLNSGLDKSDSLEEQIKSLLSRVNGISNKIKELSEDSIIEVSCAIYTSESPPLYFDKELVKRIEALGANLDIDLYLLPEGDSD